MKLTIRNLTFAAAHRLEHHEGKCSNLHGHTYTVDVVVERDDGRVDEDTGMAIDFGHIRTALSDVVSSGWDHTTILSEDDPLLATLFALATDEDEYEGWMPRYATPAPRAAKVLPFPPSAEHIAWALFQEFVVKLDKSFSAFRWKPRIVSVEVHESGTTSARYEP